jgi:predicted ATPase
MLRHGLASTPSHFPMITRLYADNFRCLSNFEMEFGPLTVLLGPNGSGKSAALSLVSGLRDFILGRTTLAKLFTPESRTRWDKRFRQTFELGVRLDDKDYKYRLVVSHHEGPARRENSPSTRLEEESLFCGGLQLFNATREETRLFHDDGTEGVQLLTDWQVSGISRIHERADNHKLIAFRNFFRLLPVIVLNPYGVTAVTKEREPVTLPRNDCSDFADFLAHIIVADAQVRTRVERELRIGALEDFMAFEAPPSGDVQVVYCLFSREGGQAVRFRLDELSSGQIAAILLQTVTCFVEYHEGGLILDEPGNFLSVSEMQPFLKQLETLAMEHGRQVILSTHHPVAIDFLAAGHGLWFERDPAGPTRRPVPLVIKEDEAGSDAYLRISDLIARGWLSGIGVESHAS